ncbi:MAG: hypothetical protein MZU84_07975 [Sphingobacterium sp.]|nr:hypothetical protein [Sphingobacterium sp.]
MKRSTESMKFSFEAPNSEKVIRELNLLLLAETDTFSVPGVILPKTDFVADLQVDVGKSYGDTLFCPR